MKKRTPIKELFKEEPKRERISIAIKKTNLDKLDNLVKREGYKSRSSVIDKIIQRFLE